MNTGGAENGRKWQSMMMVNAIAPFQLGEALLPKMADRGKMIALSSGMGSIAENSGGWVPYRTSKAALNMGWSCLALEARQRAITCVLFSPGWVKTRMGGGGAEITTEESVSAMRKQIDSLTIADTGKFLRRNGSELPW
jgi:NAD(P)-dependent dehydrogenase (short-subunit alcohol dehydrogenase family)